MFRTFKLQLFLMAVVSACLLIGCGSSGGGGGMPVVETVEVAPGIVGLSIGEDGQQLFAIAKDASGNRIDGHAFTWSIVGDDGSKGSVDQNGFYKPPAVLPDSNNEVEVKATSVSDPSKSGSARVVLLTGLELSFDGNKPIAPLSPGSNDLSALGRQSIAVKGDLVVAVWADDQGGDYKIHIAKSNNQGKTFCLAVLDRLDKQQFPSIALDSQGNAHLTWSELSGTWGVYFARFSVQETNCDRFRETIRQLSVTLVSPENDPANHQRSSIALNPDDHPFIAWLYEGSESGIYLAKGNPNQNGNFSFMKKPIVARTNQFIDPYITMDQQGRAYVSWIDGPDARSFNVYLVRCSDVSDCGPIVKVSNDNTDVVILPYPSSLAVDTFGRVYVTWMAVVGSSPGDKYQVRLARSTDEGQSFGPSIPVLGEINEDQWFPIVQVDLGGHVYVVWEDYRNGDSDIYFAKSMDGAVNFVEQSVIRDDSSNAFQLSPRLALDSAGRAFILWFDERDTGTPALYFALGQ